MRAATLREDTGHLRTVCSRRNNSQHRGKLQLSIEDETCTRVVQYVGLKWNMAVTVLLCESDSLHPSRQPLF